jgi:translation initiation factor IF-2
LVASEFGFDVEFIDMEKHMEMEEEMEEDDEETSPVLRCYYHGPR